MSKILIMATAAVAALGFAASAQAGTLLFTYTETGDGAINFTFDQSSNPTPISDSLGNYTQVPVSNWAGNIGPYTSIVWYSLAAAGQFDTADGSYVVFGPQIYGGTEDAPTFAPGTFTAADQTNGLSGTLTISNAVPEPATWAMMILGLGLTGAVLRRRHATLVAA